MKLQDLINEASLNRIRQHIDTEESWAILTSWRADLPKKENQSNFKTLQGVLKQNDLSFIKLVGRGQEEDKDGKVQSVKEPSLFVPGISLKLGKRLMKRFNQFGILYKGPEFKKIMLISIEGNQAVGEEDLE